jgi:hypothetical protein
MEQHEKEELLLRSSSTSSLAMPLSRFEQRELLSE